jgi:hypothetical protein
MERVTFLIERTGDRISCLLNPESLEARRTAGLARRRLASGSVLGNPRSDDPLIATGGGVTEYDLQLLFDVDLANEGRTQHPAIAPDAQPLPGLPDGTAPDAEPEPETDAPADPTPEPEPPPEPEPEPASALTDGETSDAVDAPAEAAADPVPEAAAPTAPELPDIFNPPPDDPGLVADVRELTQPLWALAETGEPVDGAMVQPRVRFIWGKSWNVPGVVLAVAERLECFDIDGVPRRSWLSMRLRRVEEDPEGSSAAPPSAAATPQFMLDRADRSGPRRTAESLPIPVAPDGRMLVRGDIVAASEYGDPAMARAIFIASDIDNPHSIAEGQRFVLLPLEDLQALVARADSGQWLH